MNENKSPRAHTGSTTTIIAQTHQQQKPTPPSVLSAKEMSFLYISQGEWG